jgi:hypothetical protein
MESSSDSLSRSRRLVHRPACVDCLTDFGTAAKFGAFCALMRSAQAVNLTGHIALPEGWAYLGTF